MSEDEIIVIAHDKGGVGKTTIATNLVVQLVREYGKVRVLDLDPKKHMSIFLKRRGDANIENVSYKDTKELREILKNNDGKLVVDVGGMDSDQTRTAIIYGDTVITPLSDSQIELDGLLMFKEVIKELQQVNPKLRIKVLLNRIHPSTNKSITALRNFLRTQSDVFECFDTVIRDRAAFKVAYGEGKGVYELSGADKAATEIYNLSKEL